MAQWIRTITELPVVEVKPAGRKGFSPDELVMLIGTNEPAQMFPGDDGLSVLLFDDESGDPVNERACALLEIPTAKDLRERIIANGQQPDEQLLARADDERAWEIRGNVLLARVKQETPGEATAEVKLTEKTKTNNGYSADHVGSLSRLKRLMVFL